MSVASGVTGGRVEVRERHLTLTLDGERLSFHHVWLRDNCWCADCRVSQSAERRLYTAFISIDVAPVSASWAASDGAAELRITWDDGHTSTYSAEWLRRHDYSDRARAARRHEPTLWTAASIERIPRFDHGSVVGTRDGQIAYLEAVRDFGVALVRGTPCVPGEVQRFAEALGHVRQTAFERVHNVRHDPAGYNVAHTPLELKPHTDMPSYQWPPSIQLLHFLVNDARGGESTVTDGWAILADLRREDPEAFDVLARTPVRYQLFSPEEDTCAEAPMIWLGTTGQVQTFRYSNQLALPLDVPFADVEPFYAAYRKLGAMVDSETYKYAFRSEAGDLLTVHGHRVLHGRLPYDPTSGGRHLQDVYMEYDDLMGRRRVLLGEHRPLPATGTSR